MLVQTLKVIAVVVVIFVVIILVLVWKFRLPKEKSQDYHEEERLKQTDFFKEKHHRIS